MTAMRISKIALLLSCVVALVASTTHAQNNILPEGDFETGLAPWGLHDEKEAKASGTVESVEGAHGKQAAKITVHSAGWPNHVQFACPFDSALLVAGEVYKLSFRVKAEPARPFSVHLIGAVRPWGNVGLREQLEAGPAWRRFDLPFRTRAAEAGESQGGLLPRRGRGRRLD